MIARSDAPPRVLRALIRASLPADDRDALANELDTLWRHRADERGHATANRWYARQAASFVVRVGVGRLLPDHHTLESIASDARVSLRTLRREPTFLLSFVGTLGVAVGVLSAVYSAANWVLLRPVPGVRHAEQLVTMRLGAKDAPPHVSFQISHPNLLTLRERLPQLTGLAAIVAADVDVQSRGGVPRRVAAELVTANYFGVLETRMFAGRPFVPAEDATGSPPVAVLSYTLAKSLTANPEELVGGDVRINGTPLHVVGVSEPGFLGAQLPGKPMLWLPLGALPVVDPSIEATAPADRSRGIWKLLVGRLATPASEPGLLAAANTVMGAVRAEYPNGNSFIGPIGFTFQVFPRVGLDPAVRQSVRRTLTLLLGAAAFLLCLAIANLTNLALARSLKQGDVTAVRYALGASRSRLVRSVLVETLMLGTMGGAVALVLAVAWSRWFDGVQLNERGASLSGMQIDLRVVSFTMLVSLTATALAFLRPTLMSGWRPLENLLRRGNVRAGRLALRTALGALQVALSVVLLVGAMLLGRTVANLRRIDLGFSPDRLLTVAVNPQLHGYDLARTDILAREVERRIAAEAGVVAAGVISPPPMGSSYITASLRPADDTSSARMVVGAGFYVTPGFLGALGVRVIAGDRAWRADSGTVVVTRNALAKMYPGVAPENAVGRLALARRKAVLRIAAVIENVQLSELTREPPPAIFRPLRDGLAGEPLHVYVRTSGAPLSAVPQLQRVMSSAAPEVPLYDARSARAAIDLQFIERRFMALVASTLGALGVTLAAIGLYGVLANLVAAGQREIAIRSALGATPFGILRAVLLRGFLPVGVGAVVGVAGAAVVSRLLKAQLFGLEPLDPAAFAWGIAATVGLVMLACVPPAYRATRVSIVDMLRSE